MYEPHDLRLNRMLEKMETNSAARLQWADDKESLFYIADSGRPVHIDVGYLDFGVRCQLETFSAQVERCLTRSRSEQQGPQCPNPQHLQR